MKVFHLLLVTDEMVGFSVVTLARRTIHGNKVSDLINRVCAHNLPKIIENTKRVHSEIVCVHHFKQ
jgi:hypothetical protein